MYVYIYETVSFKCKKKVEEVLAEDEELCSQFTSTCISTCQAALHFSFIRIKPGPCLGWKVKEKKKEYKHESHKIYQAGIFLKKACIRKHLFNAGAL